MRFTDRKAANRQDLAGRATAGREVEKEAARSRRLRKSPRKAKAAPTAAKGAPEEAKATKDTTSTNRARRQQDRPGGRQCSSARTAPRLPRS